MDNKTFITGKVVAYNIDFGFGTVKTEEHGELIFSKEQAEKGTSFRESQAVFLKVKQSKTGDIEIVSISDKTFQAEDVTLNKESTTDETEIFYEGSIRSYNIEKGFGFIMTYKKGGIFFDKACLDAGLVPAINMSIHVSIKKAENSKWDFEAICVKLAQPKENISEAKIIEDRRLGPKILGKIELPEQKKEDRYNNPFSKLKQGEHDDVLHRVTKNYGANTADTSFYEGKVKFYAQDKEFGFITIRGKGDVFFHSSTLEKGYIPKEDDYVLAEVVPSRKKIGSFDASFVKKNIFMTFLVSGRVLERKSIYNGLNENEQKELLEYCNSTINFDKIFEIWWEGFNIKPTMHTISYKFLVDSYPHKRKDIFEKLTENEQTELLQLYQEKATEEQLFSIWRDGFNIKPNMSIVYIKFLTNSPHYRKYIFEKLTENEQQELLQICQEKATEEQIFNIWWDDFHVKPSMEILYSKFLENSYDKKRKQIFEKLDKNEQIKLLQLLQKKCNGNLLNDIVSEGYDIELNIYVKYKIFIDLYPRYKTYIFFEKLTENEQNELLQVCQQQASEEQLFNIWLGDFNVTPNIDIIFANFLANYSDKRERIFKKLTEYQQKELLQLCQEKATEEQLFDIWREGFNVKPNTEIICDNFLANSYKTNRKQIFEKLTENEQQELLQLCQEKATEEQLFDIWREGFNVKPNTEIIYANFLANSYKMNRKQIFERLIENEQQELLQLCQEKATEEQLFDIWWGGFNVKPNTEIIYANFLANSYKMNRKQIFEKLTENEQQELLQLCQEKATEEQLFDIWREGFNVKPSIDMVVYLFTRLIKNKEGKKIKSMFKRLSLDEREEFIRACELEKLNKDLILFWVGEDTKDILINRNSQDIVNEAGKLSQAEKENIIVSFADEPHYNILLWTCGLIKQFDFKDYAFNYFRLNSNNKRLFTKKAKLHLQEAFDAKRLKTLDSWQKVREEPDGTTIYEATWRCVWFGNKYLQICMDSSEGILSHRYFWEYADEKFNLLTEYISGRRVEPLAVYYKNGKIEEIDGLGVLEETIYKAYIEQEVREGRGGKIFKGEGVPKMPVNMLLRNTCVRYLNLLQIPALEPTQVFEITTYDIEKNKKMDISVLFSIALPHDEVAVIWESLELEKSKATHLFKYAKQHHEEMFVNIQNHIEMISYIRSKLRSSQSEDVKMQTKLAYYGNIDHDNLDFEVWRNKLHKTLPTLPIPTNYKAILEV